MDPLIAVPAGAVIAVGFLVVWRWLSHLQGDVSDHAERIAWLEARVNGKHRREDG
jgi:hypothetical protein